MSKVTKIEIQAKDKNRANLYLDEKFACGLSVELVVKMGLKKGVDIDETYLAEIVFEDEKTKAMNKAVNYISSNLKTAKQIKDYLKKKDYSQKTIDYVIDKMVEYKYIDDVSYARAYISTYSSKYGKLKLRAGLRTKGISDKVIDDALLEEGNIKDSLKDVAEKYMRNKQNTREVMAKLSRFLASRGFDWDSIKEYINSISGEWQ